MDEHGAGALLVGGLGKMGRAAHVDAPELREGSGADQAGDVDDGVAASQGLAIGVGMADVAGDDLDAWGQQSGL